MGQAEALPYPDNKFGAVAFIATLCFIDYPVNALVEARRVLRPNGVLVLGELPAEGSWARHYRNLAEHDDPYFQRARFRKREELGSLLSAAGFQAERMRTALFWSPEGKPVVESAHEGDDQTAGFLAILARSRKPAAGL